MISTEGDPIKATPIFPPVSYKHLVPALLAGLALRLFFIAHFSPYSSDTKFYEELARNWLDHGVYGLFVRGQLLPVDMRMPGYPSFLAAIYAVFGQAGKAVLFVQAVIDLVTCLLTAAIAARLSPVSSRTVVATAALWIAALCPFTANYTAVALTEVLATFLTALGLLVFVCILGHPSMDLPLRSFDRRSLLSGVGWFLLGGVLVGAGTLVRPEAPLLVVAVGLVLCVRWHRRVDWSKLALAISWMAVGLLLPLTPWAVRNARTLGRIEFLAPTYAQTQGDFIPRGFYGWTQTWMVRFEDAYLAPWKLGKAPIPIETLPGSAFDSAAERARVAALLSRYNSYLQMTPVLDREFAFLARERNARHPLRTYLFIPASRAWMIWFTPRIELLPYSGKVWPPGEKWRDNPVDFGVTLGFEILNCVYLGLAFLGAWRCRSYPAVALLIAFVLIRTALLTQLQTVEPRYVIVCFPVILALGALACAIPQRDASAASYPSLALTHASSQPMG
ncbi:MAG: hypothetical protein ABSE45_06060 [Candidatus Acidiferrales bacterium]